MTRWKDVARHLEDLSARAERLERVCADTEGLARHSLRQGADTQAVATDTRAVLGAASAELAHLRGAVQEAREAQSQISGAVSQLLAAGYSAGGAHQLATLETLLASVEPYQPLYGLSLGAAVPERACADRAAAIERALGDVRGLRMLDLGTSLGYFPMYFADRGAATEGWDFKGDNVAVARMAASITGNSARFHERLVSRENVTSLRPGEFDVALCLSILHHVTAEHGVTYTKELVKDLLDRVPTVIVELAQRGEDPALYWDAAQPVDAMDIFAAFDAELEVVPLGSFGTHLSTVERPLYLVRRRASLRVRGSIVPFDTMTTEPYSDAPLGSARTSRRYYSSETRVVKEYAFAEDRPENWRQIVSELYFFTAVLPLETVHRAPTLVEYDVDPASARLVFERIPGRLLDACAPIDPTTAEAVARDVLATLRDLHGIGLHHNDVRSWNILVDEGGRGWLIDYGLCSPMAYTDDVVGLLGALTAGLTGRRETHAPQPVEYPEGPLSRLAAAITSGERDPQALLDSLDR